MKLRRAVTGMAVVLSLGAGAWMSSGAAGPKKVTPAVPMAEGPLDPFVHRGVEWLVKAQHPDGGWGAGSHANQQLRDPRQVVTDPATTAFVALALVRTGSTPEAGPYREALQRATLYLVQAVEAAPAPGPRITNIEGTQPQAKLGPLVDTGMAAQYLARILPTLAPGSPLHKRVDAALERCVRKLEESQQVNGAWNGAGGWAPVLQSSLSTSALEMAQAAGKRVDGAKLERARRYQKGNFDAASGRAEAGAAAGVELYAFSSAQRAGALEAVDAVGYLDAAKAKGDLPASAPVSEENLKKAGVDDAKARSLNGAYRAHNAQLQRLADDQLLSGFGSNGGEEYLSYLQTSEALVIAGGNGWEAWKRKMAARLAKIQSQDGSWTGHHCITSPVFCTAAVLQCLTADRDTASLRRLVQVGRRG
jgi:hypothetical protein